MFSSMAAASIESLTLERQTALAMIAIDTSASMRCMEKVGQKTLTTILSRRVGLFGRRNHTTTTTVTERVSRLDVAKAGACKVIDALSNGDL